MIRNFERWFRQLPLLQNLQVPRWIFGQTGDNITLHMFFDASKYAYAAALFVRVESPSDVNIYLVQAKSRVGPTSEISIPHMELLAATMGARLMNSVSHAMDFSNVKVFYWTDSTTVLSWLRLGRQWSRFVWNRVEEVRKFTCIENWRHVAGFLNPADLPSRGCNILQLIQSKWWEGPCWLKNREDELPQEEPTIDEDLVYSEVAESNQKCSTTLVNTCAMTAHMKVSSENTGQAWYLNSFSNYAKIVKMVEYYGSLVIPKSRATCV